MPTISNIGVSTPCEPKLRIDTALNCVVSTFKSLWSHNLVWEPVWRHKCTIVSVFTAMPKMHQCWSSDLPRLYRGRCWNSLKTWHFSENSSPKKLLLVLYHCWYRDFAWEVTPIIRDNTAASIHTITSEWWWSCGVVTVYVQCGDHNGSFKGTACFRENMNRGAPLGLVLDLCYVWIKTITTSPRKTKNKITEREISTIANPL